MTAARAPGPLSLLLLGLSALCCSALCLCALSVGGTASAHGADASTPKPASQVYVVVGVLDTVDVSVDGSALQDGVEPKTVLGPLSLTPGDHDIAFTSDAWAAESTFTVEGRSLDVVVHRPADAAADPTVSVFTNDVRPIAADKARLTVAHTAVVPPADVRVSGQVLFANIANGEFVTREVPAQTYSVDIVPTGESTPLLGPLDLSVQAGALNRVFAIGQPEGGAMDAIVQVIPLRTRAGAPPSSVDAGSAGLVDPTAADEQPPAIDDPLASAVPVLITLLGATLLVAGLALRPRRHRHAH